MMPLALSAVAQLSQIGTRWATLLDACPPDMGIDFTLNGDALYYLSCTGSTIGAGESGFPKEYSDETASIYYDGQLIATGAPYEGASFNNNFSLVKTDLDGRFQWTVYSTSADVASNNGGVVNAPDGGVYVSVVLRHTDNMRTQPIRFVDATGQETMLDWTLPNEQDKRWYNGLLMKVSAQGAIEWTEWIEVSHAPVAAATGDHVDNTGTAFYITGMESDVQGYFYVAGRYVTPMTIDAQTFTPHNTEGWNGDSQQTRGDMFVAKLDADGHLVQMLTTTGVAYTESNASLTMAQGDLFLTMTVTGIADGSCRISLDNHTVALPDDQQNVVIARLGTDLKVKWLRQWRGAQVQNRNAVMQSGRIAVAGDDLLFTGQFNGSFSDGTHTIASSTGNIREGILVKCSVTDGRWLAATTSKIAFPAMKNGIQGYLGAFEDVAGDHVCVYGYTFGGECVTLMRLDAPTLAGEEYVTLINGGSQPTAQKCLATGSALYTMSRGRDSYIPMYQLQPINSDISLATKEWAVCLAAFTLPFDVKEDTVPAAIGDVDGDGKVDVSDVNAVINVILKVDAGNQPATAADVDGDGKVDVSDVNAIINIILT